MSTSKPSASTCDTNMPPTPAYDTPVVSTGKSKPTLYHLNNSGSHRVLWLLEELSIPYNLHLYSRDPKTHQAPPTLLAIHPMGKSPVLTVPATASTPALTIAESSTIISYLLRTYDKAHRFTVSEQTPEGLIASESLVSLASSSIGPAMIMQVFSELLTTRSPMLVQPLVTLFTNTMRTFTERELKMSLACIQKELGDKNYFGGEELGTVDFVMSWPLDYMLQRKWFDLEKDFPKLAAWVNRYQGRKAYRSALEKGNGYDLATI